MQDEITAFAPATVANLACGFDILGFAMQHPGDTVTIRRCKLPGIIIRQISGDYAHIPSRVEENTAGAAVKALWAHLGIDSGVEIEIHKNLPIASGLGSSAASAAAAVVAANTLFGFQLEKKALLPFAMEGEKVASKAIHADNVAAALLGGIVLIRSYQPLDIVQLPVPAKLYYTIVYPHIRIHTAEARRVLKAEIPLKDAVTQWGNVGGLVAGLMRSDYALIGRSMEDVVAEPLRSKLIPGFRDLKQAALNSGALGCSISGSGPAVFALSDAEKTARKIGQSMHKACSFLQVPCTVYRGRINQEGAKILD